MQEFLEGYLDATVSQELKATILAARDALAKAGQGDVEDALGTVLSQESLSEGSLPIAIIEGILLPKLKECLLQFEVRVNEQTTLRVATEMLNAILAMDNWDDPERLYTLCDSDESPEEILASLVSEVGVLNEIDVLTVTDTVSPRLIEKLQEILEPTLPPPEADEEQIAIIRDRVKQFLSDNLPPSPPFLTYLLNENYRLGMPAMVYYEAFVTGLPDVIDPQIAAYQLTSFVLASPQTGETILESVAKMADALHHSPIEVAQINQFASQLILPV